MSGAAPVKECTACGREYHPGWGCPYCREIGGEEQVSRVCMRCGRLFEPRRAHQVHCAQCVFEILMSPDLDKEKKE